MAGQLTIDSGDTAWMLVSTSFVMLMLLPGLALFYGGLVRAKNLLSVMSQVLGISAVAILGWVLWGYSLPGARFLDIDALSDRSNPAPHMLPSAAGFGAAMERLGIGREDRIVVYDNSPIRTAARGWFMLRHFGAPNVAILDGGFQKWLAEGRPTESGEPPQRAARFEPQERSEVVTKQQLLEGAGLPLLDARGKGRFEGSEADPRPGVAAGHIPGARNLPFSALYDETGSFRSPEQIRRLFAEAGMDPARPFIASCGSGVTANSLIFAAHLLGNDAARLYDGSWSEWGADAATPKAVGPA